MAEVLRIGAFFDGTGNNMWNDFAIKDGSQSNVAKLYSLYQDANHKVEYEEGVGTEAYKDGVTFSQDVILGIQNGSIIKNDQYASFDMAVALGVAKEHVQSMLAKFDRLVEACTVRPAPTLSTIPTSTTLSRPVPATMRLPRK